MDMPRTPQTATPDPLKPLLEAAEEAARIAKEDAERHQAEVERILKARKKPGFTGRNTRPKTRGREP